MVSPIFDFVFRDFSLKFAVKSEWVDQISIFDRQLADPGSNLNFRSLIDTNQR